MSESSPGMVGQLYKHRQSKAVTKVLAIAYASSDCSCQVVHQVQAMSGVASANVILVTSLSDFMAVNLNTGKPYYELIIEQESTNAKQ